MAYSGVHEEGARPASRPAPRARNAGGGGDGGSGSGDGGRHGRRRGKRRHRVLRWSATTLAVLILGTAGAGYLYYQHLNGNIRKGERSSGDSKAKKTEANAAGQTPLNILLIGSDSRNSDENVELGGSRDNRGNPPLGDVQMLIHLSADRKSAAMVTIPRDTRVDIPQCTDPETGKTYEATTDIINTSLARGGAGCTLATWQNLTGVYIDHWMTIDFSGVVRMADAIGGVSVCVRQNVWDRPTAAVPGGSGLKMTKGTHKVKGKQALQWLRTRHAWGSDLMRARAQHMYLNSMIRTLKGQNVFTDTPRLMGLAEAATKSLQVSEEIGSVKDLYDLGMQLKSVPPDRITSVTMPNVEDPRNRDHVVPDGANADRLWEMLRDDVALDKNGKASSGGKKTTVATKAPSAPDGEIGVLVRNATATSTLGPVSGRAGAIAAELVQKGFSRASKDATNGLSEERTVVRYPSAELQGDAQRVAKSLGIPMSSVKKSTDVSGVTLVVGADWREGTAYPKVAEARAGDVPGNADAINGSDTGQCMDVYSVYRW
ncbi:LCP family protein required for cell wall assembly [Streptomyces sp. SAI-208]|uniref:LCP family protein n=1 Tax=unclassified Streptomyces TaxID=2593676 RepID=UPI00247587B2|nr:MULTISPECIES: LCP family protein [unclassified Streptomyces]MDH6518626.1 LCP family protein required for cell wall assembly [Streptomyces sp. SAI-090]MDH6550846.1 LCP family protein required for cell wall assembly [Streptomyces sp. SAI-041]MDH6609473.1 LCP family protein required for cell wall assembly [Streptomyces sp. SAI-208]MDH6617279.1 LCP family protein required for cell wall assembly [Streptomyces sp. SAI-135]